MHESYVTLHSAAKSEKSAIWGSCTVWLKIYCYFTVVSFLDHCAKLWVWTAPIYIKNAIWNAAAMRQYMSHFGMEYKAVCN